MIAARNLNPNLKALVNGLMVGNVYYVGTNGDNMASGAEYKRRLKNLYYASPRLVSGNNDYVLCFGSETGPGSVEISAANAHVIGCSMGIGDTMGRGYAYTCPATADTLQPTVAADYLEIANIKFICSATDHILIDDAGCDDAFFHHNTVYGSTTASDAVRLDIEGARWTINDNIFQLCKLAIDLAGPSCVVRRNSIHDVDTAAKGVVIGAAAHYCIVTHNTFNLTGTTGDVALTIAASADNTELNNNLFSALTSDMISDSGTATVMHHNYSTAITGTSGASLQLVVVN
jgi:hypothetical protein